METETTKKRWDLAMLMNTLVMPGSGHMLVDRKAKGYILGLLTIFFICFPSIHFTAMVFNMRHVNPPQGTAGFSTLNALSGAWAADKGLILASILAVVVIWLYGIIDLVIMKRRASGSM